MGRTRWGECEVHALMLRWSNFDAMVWYQMIFDAVDGGEYCSIVCEAERSMMCCGVGDILRVGICKKY